MVRFDVQYPAPREAQLIVGDPKLSGLMPLLAALGRTVNRPHANLIYLKGKKTRPACNRGWPGALTLM